MAELRGFLVTAGAVNGMPTVGIDGMYVLVEQSLERPDQPGLAFAIRLVPAEAMHLADQLARAARSLDAVWYAAAERPEYVPLRPEGAR